MLSINISIEQKIEFSECEKAGVEVFVKRDDKIHPFISGNKWRKLKYNYQTYLKSGLRGIVTFGGAFSNHIIATAAFCAENKIPCIGIIRGEQPKDLNHVLILAKLWGMKLNFISREAYKDKTELSKAWQQKGYFVIPEGGENAEGVRGCSEIITELTRNYDHIICASGTGCTFAGLVQGVSNLAMPAICHSIPVLKQGGFIHEKVLEYFPTANIYKIHTEYHFGGYAKTTPELWAFLQSFARETGILTDPVYTAKMFYALGDLIKLGEFKRGQSVLAIHTGGLTGLLSEKMLRNVQKE